MPKKEANELSSVTRALIYLSGASFKGMGVYAQALPYALKVLGKDTWSGSAKNFLKANLGPLKAHVAENRKQLAAIRSDRKAQRQSSPRAARTKPNVSVTSDAFLLTFDWRKVRMQALKKYGPKCMCCGATPATGAVMNVDHIKPRKTHPHLALDINNLQILCHECNHGKGNWDSTDWR